LTYYIGYLIIYLTTENHYNSKGDKEMKGTDKQVAWAQEIRQNVIAILNKTIEDIKAMNAPEASANKLIGEINDKIAALNEAEYAGDIIDLFKGIRADSTPQKVFAVYNTRTPMTEGQKAILCK